jgi:4-amino-4-deoxy-L-arabinose transferase-like glycosyltransferase
MSRIVALISRRPLVLILALALLLRVGMLIALYPTLFAFEDTDAVHGSQSFDVYAQNLLNTGVYGLRPHQPDAVLPPLYGLVLAGIYAVLGRSGLAVGLVHTAFDLLSIALLYAMALRLGARITPRARAVAALAALAFAIYPYLIFQNLTVIDTPLFILLLHAFLLALIWLRERPRFDRAAWALALGAGVLLGLGTLLRPTLPLLALAAALWFVLRLSFWQTAARLLPVALVGAALVLPWSAYVSGIYGAFVPVALNGGGNFYQGSNPDVVPYLLAGYDTQWTAPDSAAALSFDERHNPDYDRALMQLAWSWLSQNPGVIPELLWVKFWTHWSIDITPRRNPAPGERPALGEIRESGGDGGVVLEGLAAGDPVTVYDTPLFDQIGRWVHRLYFGALFVLACVGLLLTLRHARDAALLWLVQVTMTVIYVFFHPSTRYRSPTDPLLFVLSAYALLWLWTWARRRAVQPAVAR